MRFEQLGPFQPALDLAFDIAGAIFAALGVDTQERFQMRATTSQFLRKIKHFPKASIPRDKSEIGVEGRKALIDVVKRGLHQIELRLELLCLLHGGE